VPSELGADLVPYNTILYQAFLEDLPEGVGVVRDLEVNDVDELPFILFYTSGEGAGANDQGLWPFTLTVNAIGIGADPAEDAAKAAYHVLHGWKTTRYVTGLGGVRWVRNISLFAEVHGESKAMIGKPIAQWTGIFSMLAFSDEHFHL